MPVLPGAERGVSNREGDTRYLCFTTLCQESIPAALSPRLRSLQWAATPKLTMIAGAGNFPSGSSRCESFLYNPTIADENAETECGRGRKMRGRPVNRVSKNISYSCDRSEFIPAIWTEARPIPTQTATTREPVSRAAVCDEVPGRRVGDPITTTECSCAPAGET